MFKGRKLRDRVFCGFLGLAVLVTQVFPASAWAAKAGSPSEVDAKHLLPFPADNSQKALVADNICQNAVERAREHGLDVDQVGVIITVYDPDMQMPQFVGDIVLKCRSLGVPVRKVKLKNKWHSFVKTIQKRVPYELDRIPDESQDSQELAQMIDHFQNTLLDKAETEKAYRLIGSLPRSFFRRTLINNFIAFKRFFGVQNGVTLSMYFDDDTGLKRPWKDRVLVDDNGIEDVQRGTLTEFKLKGHLILTSFMVTFISVVAQLSSYPLDLSFHGLTSNPLQIQQAFLDLGIGEDKIFKLFTAKQWAALASGATAGLASLWLAIITGQANNQFINHAKQFSRRMNKIVEVPIWGIPAQILISAPTRILISVVAFGPGILLNADFWSNILKNVATSATGKVHIQQAIAKMKKTRQRANVTQDGKAKSDLFVYAMDSLVQTGFTILSFAHLLTIGHGPEWLNWVFYGLGISGFAYLLLKILKGPVEAPLYRFKAWKAIWKGLKIHVNSALGRVQPAPSCQVHVQVVRKDGGFSHKEDPVERKESIERKEL